ncbi:hypothetical protein E5676_scaffold443G001070 [Cucumis melo var. makuwa]|uniref:Uncharacterized protein n=1 Tax=Cucumis melo var. makuwa TaxID=1194695 RepID=A0A5D3D7D1_CUCMM|nr:hypothetical protein E5676_scaffold443G001070 [Cucumis melo var. makuwa]
MEVGPKISGEAVIEKLKDDGDFDKLRLKIIRKLKDNEELRNNIVAIVKQSAALNRAGTENVKPRQISDAIYDELKFGWDRIGRLCTVVLESFIPAR